MRCSKQNIYLYPLLSLALVFLLGGCLTGKPNNVSTLPGQSGLPFADQTMSASFYQKETGRWQAVIQESAERGKKAEAQLHLAALNLSSDNPHKDYHQGYLFLSQATVTWPGLLDNVAVANWLGVLNSYEKQSLIATNKIAALENKLAQAEQNIAQQRQELATLRETLDKLKRLEMSVEKKRRIFK